MLAILLILTNNGLCSISPLIVNDTLRSLYWIIYVASLCISQKSCNTSLWQSVVILRVMSSCELCPWWLICFLKLSSWTEQTIRLGKQRWRKAPLLMKEGTWRHVDPQGGNSLVVADEPPNNVAKRVKGLRSLFMLVKGNVFSNIFECTDPIEEWTLWPPSNRRILKLED